MNHQLKLYDHLLQFPLFQGLSRAELLQMAGNTKFGFAKMPARHTLVRADDPCSGLYFLISGSLQVVTEADDHGYCVVEQLGAPWMLQPEVLFGAQTRHTFTATTLSDCSLISLSKDEVMRLLDDFLIVRLNLLNHLATQAQRRAHLQWRRSPQSLRDRIVRFLIDHCVYPAGPKDFHILMERLARELNDSRLDISRALNAMHADRQVVLHRGRIEVPSLERLIMG